MPPSTGCRALWSAELPPGAFGIRVPPCQRLRSAPPRRSWDSVRGVRQLLPEPLDEVDPDDVYPADDRPAPAGRPWVLLNMVTSVDGATALEGRSGALGGGADRAVFRVLRSVPDVIMVGAATVRAERYGPPRTSEAHQAARRARGQDPFPRLAIVSGRLDLDVGAELFTATPTRPIVITASAAPADRRAELAEVADLVVAGDERVDLAAALAELRGLDRSVVLCEGGPSLNAQLLAAGLVDEVCATIGPVLVGGSSKRMIEAATPDTPEPLRLVRLLEADGVLLVRYVRT
jgi:riboflavin-specific deaminase-like protein